MAPNAATVLTLPASVVSRVDIIRLARELEAVTGAIEQRELTKNHETSLSPLSKVLKEIVEANKLSLARKEDRARLSQFLKDLKADAPSIHMSFAAIPPSAFTAKIVDWLRNEIHPLLLLDIGLQPSIAAGCVIRTTNKYFDCSMRQHLLTSRPKLIEMMRSKTA